ncbi:nuclear transport factor 2 family protein [Mycobacterium sp. 852002-51057_SCH5723018]|uniref:nuclear transport factor 2 family protein n=1 Tax=Mycobacterium sp. 852002-51057_SCH5723018 TaxID=1834094 RepID=UPI0007FEEB73|nr:nuclear transport factor 2 family protein [Mycobacterium sp. 852002-51057_SCH5723018]OBG30545.1 polyketide cyclase [Mycobacterium sp. 852002-51057_SCH5723018]
MTDDVTLSELQEFIGGFWYHYDEAHFDELAVAYAHDVRYLTRSDSGTSPFEEMMSPELNGRDTVMQWLSEHRNEGPYPLRHHATNVHRTGTDGDITRARFYIFVNQTANFVPFAVSSGVVNVAVRRGVNGLEFTEMDVVLDATNSVALSELTAGTAAGS